MAVPSSLSERIDDLIKMSPVVLNGNQTGPLDGLLLVDRRPIGRWWAESSLDQPVQPLQVIGQAHQTPLAAPLRQPAQRELPEAQYLFYDPNHRFHRTF